MAMSEIGRNYLSDFMSAEQAPEEVVEEKTEQVEDNTETTETVEADKVVEETTEETTEVETEVKTKENAEEVIETKTEDTSTDDEVIETTEPVVPEITDDAVLNYLKQKSGKELSSIDELFKEPEQKEDPFKGLSEKTRQFLEFNKETGRDYDDFLKLDTDYTALTPLQKAQQKAIEFSDGELTTSDVNEFLERELNVDLSDPNALDKFDAIKLKGYAKDWEKQKIQEQEKYKQPIEKVEENTNAPEIVTLENGFQVSKEQYESMVAHQNQYKESVKAASDNIKASVFQVKFDDNGTERTLDLSYDYSKDEVRKMTESALDIDNAFKELFGNENGIDYAELQEGLFWAKRSNREKAVAAITHKARAEYVKEDTRTKTNANFNTKQMPDTGKRVKTVPIPGTKPNYGIKYDINQF